MLIFTFSSLCRYGSPRAKICVSAPAWPTRSGSWRSSCRPSTTLTRHTSAGSSLGSCSRIRHGSRIPRSRRTLSSKSSSTRRPFKATSCRAPPLRPCPRPNNQGWWRVDGHKEPGLARYCWIAAFCGQLLLWKENNYFGAKPGREKVESAALFLRLLSRSYWSLWKSPRVFKSWNYQTVHIILCRLISPLRSTHNSELQTEIIHFSVIFLLSYLVEFM